MGAGLSFLPAVKAVIYFVVLKVAFQLTTNEGISIVAALLIAAAATGVEFVAYLQLPRLAARQLARGHNPAAAMVWAILLLALAAVVATFVVAMLIVFAFSEELYQREFSRWADFQARNYWRYYATGVLTLAGTIALMMGVNAGALAWGMSRTPRP